MGELALSREVLALRAAVFRIAEQNGMRTADRPVNGAANTTLFHDTEDASGPGAVFAVGLDSAVPDRDRTVVGRVAGRMVVRALRRAGFRVETEEGSQDRIFRVMPRSA